MAIFTVTSREAPTSGPPKPRASRFTRRSRRNAAAFLAGALIIATLATLLSRIGLAAVFFVLLPVITSVIITVITTRARIAIRRLVYMAGLALIYFGAVIGWELLTHGPQTRELIVVTTTLALAVLFQPIRDRIQVFMEQRFNLRDDAAAKAVADYTATLREEIDLDQIRTGLLSAAQRAMQPLSVALWLRMDDSDESTSVLAPAYVETADGSPLAHAPDGGGAAPETTTSVSVDDGDPLLTYAQQHTGALELAKLPLDSPLLRTMRTRQMELALALASQPGATPGQTLAQVNDLLAADLPPGMFVTCFYTILDPNTGRLDFANAGQDLPFVRHETGEVSEVDARGMPLGLLPAMGYDEHTTTLAPGDTLLFYSDGLVEAHSPRHEMFGFPRLTALLAEGAAATSSAVDGGEPATSTTDTLIDTLLHDLAAFTGDGWEQEDDLTLVTLRRESDATRRSNEVVP